MRSNILYLLSVTAAYRVNVPNYMHIDGLVGKNKNGVYGRAFAAEMMKFDKDEGNFTYHFDFAEESKHLQKVGVHEVIPTPKTKGLGGILTRLLHRLLEKPAENYCKHFR